MIDRSLPLVDLHRHLDGNVRLETIIELGRQHNLSLPAFFRVRTVGTGPCPGYYCSPPRDTRLRESVAGRRYVMRLSSGNGIRSLNVNACMAPSLRNGIASDTTPCFSRWSKRSSVVCLLPRPLRRDVRKTRIRRSSQNISSACPSGAGDGRIPDIAKHPGVERSGTEWTWSWCSVRSP